MPKVGDKKFPYTPEGMAAAKAESKNMGIPMNNGAERNVQSYAGGGKTGFNRIGMQNPQMNTGNQPMGDPPGYNWAEDVIPQEDNFNLNWEEGGKVKYEDGGKLSAYDKALKNSALAKKKQFDRENRLKKALGKDYIDVTASSKKTKKINKKKKKKYEEGGKTDKKLEEMRKEAKIKPKSKSADQALKDMKAGKSVFDNQKSVFDK